MNRGIAYSRKGEYSSALADLNKAIELRIESLLKYQYLWTTHVDCYLFRGQVYQAMGLKSEAIADFEKVLELTKNPAWIQVARKGIDTLKVSDNNLFSKQG